MSKEEDFKHALEWIKRIAWSDEPCEELATAQTDLRNIYFIADKALTPEKD